MTDQTNLPVISNEDETELTIFAKISNPDGLTQATSQEAQIQITAKLGLEDNTCRVRRSAINDTVKYVYTFKVPSGSESDPVASKREHNVDVNEEFFNDFKTVADFEQIKTRYIFESEKITLSYKENDEDKVIDIPDIKYEVDVFKKADGNLSEWCKIDIEIDTMMQFLEHNYPEIKNIKLNVKISHLPFAPGESFLMINSDAEIMSRVRDLYDQEFTIDLVALRQQAQSVESNEAP